MSGRKRIVLDEMTTPDGVRELVAYRDRGATWIGVAKRNGSLLAAIDLGTDPPAKELETTASIERGCGIAFGTIAPRIVRAEVRTDDERWFPARIVPLPEGFDGNRRAVWGLAQPCRHRCEVIGFDDEGRPYDQTDPRVVGPPPSDDDRLDAIHAHAEREMRYYATAYHRENDANRRLINSSMHQAANYLALLEGAALDDRSMMARGRKIVERYLERARSEPYEPGRCSFCGATPVAAWFEGPNFTSFVRSSRDVRSGEAWLACASCLELVHADDRAALAARAANRADSSDGDVTRSELDERFWDPRDRALNSE